MSIMWHIQSVIDRLDILTLTQGNVKFQNRVEIKTFKSTLLIKL